MDQARDHIDPEIAQEIIALLNGKIANLRKENEQLQVQSNCGLQNRPFTKPEPDRTDCPSNWEMKAMDPQAIAPNASKKR